MKRRRPARRLEVHRGPWRKTSSESAPREQCSNPYCQALPNYLTRLAREAIEKRETALEKLTSRAAVTERQSWVEESLWKLIGGKLERTALHVRTSGELKRDRYRVEKLIYESQPRLFITANLYLPERKQTSFPAVLFQCRALLGGQRLPSYQECCQGLVQLGFVVLAFDPMGQGERIYYPDASGTRSRLKEVDSEHTVPGQQFLLFGDTSTRFQLWGALRSLDVLLSRPEVNREMRSFGRALGRQSV